MKKTAKKPRTITISDEPPEITADFDSLEPFDSDKIFEELDNDFFQLEKQLDEMDLSELDNFELPELDLSDIEIFDPNEIDLSFQGLDDDNFTDDFMKWLTNGDENSSGGRYKHTLEHQKNTPNEENRAHAHA